MERIRILHGNITELAVDAIVNAANPTLLGGGGVDGAIHAAAGPQLLEACRAIAEVSPGVRCPTGEARITEGFALPARYVIHTVGPIWRSSGDEPALLEACYINCLTIAGAHAIRSVAFPAVSTGVYGFPKLLAARIAVATIRRKLAELPTLERVFLVAFGDADEQPWKAALAEGLRDEP